MEDPAALVLHLHLLGGIAVFQLVADVGDDVQGDLVGEGLALHRTALCQGRHLLLQLHQAGLARAGDRLIGAGHHGLDGRELVDGGHRHQGNDGGAVGVGDNALVVKSVGAVDLGYHQGHVWIQTEAGAVVHKHRAGLYDGGGKLFGHAAAHGAQDEIHALEAAFAGLLNGDVPPLEEDGAARAAGAGQGPQRLYRKIILLQNLEHLAAHGAGGA